MQNNKIKVWEKCIERCKQINYTQNPPLIKEWICAEREILADTGDLVEKVYDIDGILIEVGNLKEWSYEKIKYDSLGNITERFTNLIKYNYMCDEIDFSIDNNGNTTEEKLDYDEKGNTIRKSFIKNGKLNDYLEFEYDDKGKVVLTVIYNNCKIQYYEKEISNSDDDIYLLKYDKNKKLILINESIIMGKSIHINYSYLPNGDLINKNELDYHENGEMNEQRFYNAKEELVKRKIFGPVDENGYRLFEKHIEYISKKPSKEKITTYEYYY